MAFAGFSPGEAEGLRRAMSRKRSEAAIEAYHQRFVEGATRTHGVDAGDRRAGVVDDRRASRASASPRPTARPSACSPTSRPGCASTTARSSCASLLNEQPMGFYAPDTLAHEAQRRGIEMLAADVNASEVECTVVPPDRAPADRRRRPPQPRAARPGLRPRGARRRGRGARGRPRASGGPFRSPADLASRAGAGRAVAGAPRWAGACDALVGRRGARRTRGAPRCGSSASPRRACRCGTRARSSRCRWRSRPRRRCERWRRGTSMVADYATTGLTLGPHPLALLRPSLPRGRGRRSPTWRRCPTGRRCASAGWSWRASGPGTAKGIVFLLLEDEFGTINLIVPPDVYERHRLTVRTEPLVLAEGRLERLRDRRRGDQRARPRPRARSPCPTRRRPRSSRSPGRRGGRGGGPPTGGRRARRPWRPRPRAGGEAAEGAAADFRGVAPAVQSFAAGRRR